MDLLKRRRIIASQRGEDTTDYTLLPLTFKCLTGGDLSIKNTNGSYDRNFEYSLNGGAWTAFDLPKSTASKLIATLSPNDTISFRRDNENFADAQFISDSNLTFDIYGNLLSLQYGSAFNGQTELRNTNKQAFGPIFKETNVVDASKLMLTATSISNGCYSFMFSGCTYLEKAPNIYATTLSNQCCQRMFENCINLICGPSVLYALNLPQFCYQYMFLNCVSLVYAPEIYATNILGRAAFANMFEGCTSLITPPNINVVQITNGIIEAFYQMFKGCTSLTSAPELRLTTIYKNMYKGMFDGCSSLTTAPNLPATTLAESCYMEMFKGCTSLIAAPELPATTIAKNCYNSMFKDCTNLVSVQNELPATTLAEACYQAMFNNCTSLLVAPELLAESVPNYGYREMFEGCSQLNYIKCLATNFLTNWSTTLWISGVSNTGTFVKASGATWPSGTSGIPNGWTVIEE